MSLEVTHELGVEGGLVPADEPSDADLFDSIVEAIATVDDTIALDKTKFTTSKAYAVAVTTTGEAAGLSTENVASGMGLEEDDIKAVETAGDDDENPCVDDCDSEPTDCDSFKTMSAGCASDCPADFLATYEKHLCPADETDDDKTDDDKTDDEEEEKVAEVGSATLQQLSSLAVAAAVALAMQ